MHLLKVLTVFCSPRGEPLVGGLVLWCDPVCQWMATGPRGDRRSGRRTQKQRYSSLVEKFMDGHESARTIYLPISLINVFVVIFSRSALLEFPNQSLHSSMPLKTGNTNLAIRQLGLARVLSNILISHFKCSQFFTDFLFKATYKWARETEYAINIGANTKIPRAAQAS